MDQQIKEKYERWIREAKKDGMPELLQAMRADENEILESFYMDLEFGTAGLRGILGAGTNRMNVYTVVKASQGLALYVCRNFPEGKRSIAVSYDSRHKSRLFAEIASAVFAQNGISVYLFPTLFPTPGLSFAVRRFSCSAGVMVTASHNPAQYNGYKVYGADGCQMTTESTKTVYDIIETLDIFNDTQWGDFDALVREGKITYIGEDTVTAYIEAVKQQSVLSPKDAVDKDVAIVYTPLYGAGYVPVQRLLSECGYRNVTIVEEQKDPNGDFPTCPYPNPEIPETMALGVAYCKKVSADLLLATDPDSDRCAIAVRKEDGDYRILSGNETGVLLLDFILSRRKENHTLPENPVFVKSIVTTDLASDVAHAAGIDCKECLTGFKYIGEQILKLEEKGEENRYIFGFEESCGYLSGTYARDKDAVNAVLLITEMFAYYKTHGKSLLTRLDEISREHGYYVNKVYSFTYEGIAGKARMKEIMDTFRHGLSSVGAYPVERMVDYRNGVDGLPKADVLRFVLPKGASVILRPSGTEPKMKVYVTSIGKTKEEAVAMGDTLYTAIKNFM